MIQFSQNEIDVLRKKTEKDSSIIEMLKARTSDLINSGISIPETGIGTWSHYYYCPEHSVMLKLDMSNSEEHVCPVDGKVFAGEPYVGAWWRLIHGINAKGCHDFSLLWLLTGENAYLDIARSILGRYARYYPGYEIHGGIPHNGPGKATAQTLNEADWIQQLAFGYDIIKDQLSAQEVTLIEYNLFTIGAEFLAKHRTAQIHNHEVVINSAIGVLGLILGRKDLIEFAVNSRYGLKYQLENAVLKDYFWFEGTVHYHYFALEAFMEYEKFAMHTPYSLLQLPYYREMLKFPIRIMQSDFSIPLINDSKHDTSDKHLKYEYEFPYKVYGDREFAWILNNAYKDKPRNSLEAFLYGADEIPVVEGVKLENYHNADGSGLTVLRGSNGRYLLVKHGPFGGEHDHYDRLGISFNAYGCRIAYDLGTTGYGAKLHYDYYKNTGAHNTVVIGEENQAPVNGRVLKYEEKDGYILLDVEAVWDGSFVELDSHTRVEWDEKSYRGVKMRRIILWHDEYFIEVFKVSGVKNLSIDWVLHVGGSLREHCGTEEFQGVFSSRKPFKYLKNVMSLKPERMIKGTWSFDKCDFTLYSLCANSNTVFYAEGPDNPSVRDISYMINRVVGDEALFVNVFEAHEKGEPFIKDTSVEISDGAVQISVDTKAGKKNSTISLL